MNSFWTWPCSQFEVPIWQLPIWLPLVLALRKRLSFETRVRPLFWFLLPFWPCYPVVQCHNRMDGIVSLLSSQLSPRKSEMQSTQLQMKQAGNVWSLIFWANVQNNKLLHKNSHCLSSWSKTQLLNLALNSVLPTVRLARVRNMTWIWASREFTDLLALSLNCLTLAEYLAL